MRYFAFGSNLCRAQFAARCPGSRPVSRATLRGWRLAFRGHGHADIVRQKGGVVQGALYEVTDGDLAALDRYEGAPHYYHRIKVRVRDDAGRLVWALAYKMRADCDDALPSLSYRQTILRGCHEWGIRPEGTLAAAGSGNSNP
jgi:gamma-glutamylcyclotransferase (GGCT)/AIG2-like uncharacterized protein YtfP